MPGFWLEELEFRSYAKPSDCPALDAAGWYIDFNKNFRLIFFKATEPHN